MKRTQNREQLNAVLDAPHLNGDHHDDDDDSNNNHASNANALSNPDNALLDDDHIKRLANEQEDARKQFDNVLARPPEYWTSVSDPVVLSEALVTILHHIREQTGLSSQLSAHPVTNHYTARPTSNGNISSGNHATPADDDETANPLNGSHAMSNGTALKAGPDKSPATDGNGNNAEDTVMDDFADASNSPIENAPVPARSQNSVASRAKYIPLRLSAEERKLLRLVEAALNVSEYTDVVDVLMSRSKAKQRIHTQIRDLCSILTGLAVANDYAAGQRLVADRDFAHNEAFFQEAFEVARRHKVANPEKSRETYGKLIHMLQDSAQEDITAMLEFTCVKPLRTVSSFLEERGGLSLLDDPLIETATQVIIPDMKPRRVIQREITEKERAVAFLAKRYSNHSTLSHDDIRRCLYSIGDNNSYLRSARDPCDTMLKYLHMYFKPDSPGGRENSLAIANGVGGARLTHDHNRQFRYVHQSLALWREVCHEMYKLWYLSETDLLSSGNSYMLKNTGQGLNRVQSAPSVQRAMNGILGTVQRRVGQWVGSSVVHLGDYNVPNALVFIDKYAQVQRILGPLCTSIRRLGEVAKEDKAIARYIDDTFGGVEAARKMILRDFFRHAFDGSGASDWFSAGSCIDGRLTSAWNWCSEIEKRSYWPLFLLTGLTGFDGEF